MKTLKLNAGLELGNNEIRLTGKNQDPVNIITFLSNGAETPRRVDPFYHYVQDFSTVTALPAEWLKARPDVPIGFQQTHEGVTGIKISQTLTDASFCVYTDLPYPYQTISKVEATIKCCRNNMNYQIYGDVTIKIGRWDPVPTGWVIGELSGGYREVMCFNGGDTYDYATNKRFWQIGTSTSYATSPLAPPFRAGLYNYEPKTGKSTVGKYNNYTATPQEFVVDSTVTFDFPNQKINFSVENIDVPMNQTPQWAVPTLLEFEPTDLLRIMISPYTWFTGAFCIVEKIELKIWP